MCPLISIIIEKNEENEMKNSYRMTWSEKIDIEINHLRSF